MSCYHGDSKYGNQKDAFHKKCFWLVRNIIETSTVRFVFRFYRWLRFFFEEQYITLRAEYLIIVFVISHIAELQLLA